MLIALSSKPQIWWFDVVVMQRTAKICAVKPVLTIIYALLTNDIIVLWCRCGSRRSRSVRFLTANLSNEGGYSVTKQEKYDHSLKEGKVVLPHQVRYKMF